MINRSQRSLQCAKISFFVCLRVFFFFFYTLSWPELSWYNMNKFLFKPARTESEHKNRLLFQRENDRRNGRWHYQKIRSCFEAMWIPSCGTILTIWKPFAPAACWMLKIWKRSSRRQVLSMTRSRTALSQAEKIKRLLPWLLVEFNKKYGMIFTGNTNWYWLFK